MLSALFASSGGIGPGRVGKDGSPRPDRGPPSRPSSPCSPGAQGWQKGTVLKHNVSAEVNHGAAAPPPLGRASRGSGHRGRGSSGPEWGGQVPLPPRPAREPGRGPGPGPPPKTPARAPQPGEAPSATGVRCCGGFTSWARTPQLRPHPGAGWGEHRWAGWGARCVEQTRLFQAATAAFYNCRRAEICCDRSNVISSCTILMRRSEPGENFQRKVAGLFVSR